MEATII